eukprot:scaffold66872_cov55-Phaeocystis_antarctica.AAC.1
MSSWPLDTGLPHLAPQWEWDDGTPIDTCPPPPPARKAPAKFPCRAALAISDVERAGAGGGADLLVADNTAGYFGVYLTKPGQPKTYQAKVRRGGNQVTLGMFATAEEAALCVARSPEGQAVVTERAATAPAQLTSEEARQQAKAEELTLLVAESKTGYFGVHFTYPGQLKPYQAKVRRGGKQVSLGSFATAEQAALHVARSPEGQAAAKRAAAAAPLTSEEARQQAQAEGLTLLVAKNKTGYYAVLHSQPGRPKPYQAQVWRGGKDVYLGMFATAEEAALCVARSPEGQAAAQRAASAPTPLTSEAEVKNEPPATPSGAVVKEEGMVPPMPPGAYVKVEVVVKEEEGSDGGPKRLRSV